MTTPLTHVETPELNRLLAEAREDFLSRESEACIYPDLPDVARQLFYSTADPMAALFDEGAARLTAVTLEMIALNPSGELFPGELIPDGFLTETSSFHDVLRIAIRQHLINQLRLDPELVAEERRRLEKYGD